MRKLLMLCGALTVLLASTQAQAEAGDLLIKTRAAYQLRSHDFSVVLPGSVDTVDAGAKNTIGAEASLTMFVTDSVAVELALGGSEYGLNNPAGAGLVSSNLLMSTATVQYHFASERARFRPYAGAGLTHLNLYGERVEAALFNGAPDRFTNYSATLRGGFAPVGQIGADIALNDQVYVNIDAKYTTRKTEIFINREAPQSVSRDTAFIIIGAGVGFRF